MPVHTFILNGKRVSVDCEDDAKMLWVLRDLLGVKGPKYGCGISVCQACVSHINGSAVNMCVTPISAVRSKDKVTTIEGLAATSKKDLHPMQQAWLDHDVAQCGYCQAGQIMTAVSLVRTVHAKGRRVRDSDLDKLRNVCRCGTYVRVRAAIKDGDVAMGKPKRKAKKKKAKHKTTAHH